MVMQKVSPWKGVIRFGKHGKLSPWYVGSFKIIDRLAIMAYKLELPDKICGIHNTFYVSNLKKCLTDENLVIPLKEFQLDDKLHFIDEPSSHGNEKIISGACILISSRVIRRRARGIEHRDNTPLREGGYQNHLLAARSRQKSYTDIRRKALEFDVGDMVMQKVSPWKGVIRFGKHGKLSPWYVGPFKIIDRLAIVAYKLELPDKICGIHNTFYVSNLKKCLADENLVIPLKEFQLDDKLHFIDEPVEIMNHEVKQHKQSWIPIVFR
nr:putative reverse transcriptase domain-containing protein [Tanacetum cinerariifolium]